MFEDNFAELETIAAQPDAGEFERLWERLMDFTREATAFLEMVIDARRDLPDHGDSDRLLTLVTTTLPRAQAAGLINPELSADDVLLAQRMVYGVVVTTTDPDQVKTTVDRALTLLHLHSVPATRRNSFLCRHSGKTGSADPDSEGVPRGSASKSVTGRGVGQQAHLLSQNRAHPPAERGRLGRGIVVFRDQPVHDPFPPEINGPDALSLRQVGGERDITAVHDCAGPFRG